VQQRVIIGIVVAAVVVIAGLWWWQSRPVAVPAPAPVPPAPVSESGNQPEMATPVTPAVQAVPLPPLNDSDAFVREQVAQLPGQQLSVWLTQDDLVRRLAVVIDNAAGGEYPRRQLGFLAPAGKFSVVTRDEAIFVDPESYARYDAFVDSVVSVEPQRAAAMLKTAAPLLVEAMKELGQLDPDPVAAIHKGIQQVLATPVLDEEPELVQPKVFYLYADPALESLKPLQKQLLRMGPANVQRLQDYLRQVDGYL
jgi:hypothetical protein